MWHVKTNMMPVIQRAIFNHFRFIQKKSEQHTGKARHQGTRGSSHIEHCAYTLDCSNTKVRTKPLP